MYVTSFFVFHTKVTVKIGLKEVVEMVTSIPLIRCLCCLTLVKDFYWEHFEQGLWS